jgi:HEAT repeat protein
LQPELRSKDSLRNSISIIGTGAREKVVFALGGMEDEKSISFLKRSLNDQSAGERKIAQESLKNIGESN